MKYASILILLLISLAIASCKVSDDTIDDGKTAEDVGSKTSDQNDDDGIQLKEILSKRVSEYTVEYQINSQNSSEAITMVMDLPRFVTITTNNQGEIRSISDGTSYYMCNNMQEEWQCLKLKMEKAQTSAVEQDVNDDNAKIQYIGLCSLAGEKGTRYEVSADGKKTSLCYTGDGIMLEMVTFEMEMQATSVKRSVDANLFVPPAVPQDIDYQQ